MNVSFDGIELSEYGFALQSFDGRNMAEWKSELREVLGRQSIADVSTGFNLENRMTCVGTLSADTDNFSLYNHAELLKRRDAIYNDVINPRKGYRKLIISGDSPTRWRWARGISAIFEDRFPIFKIPFVPFTMAFQCYEPYWREEADRLYISSFPYSIPMSSAADVTPSIKIHISDKISAYEGAIVHSVTLLTIDDFQLGWKGLVTDEDGELDAGDVLVIDSSSLTAVLRRADTSMTDVIRHYAFSGPGAFGGSGFPLIQSGGSTLNYMHPKVAFVEIDYDYLYL